jgi:cysteine desulfurase
VDELGVDYLTVVGHKFGAPKGVACLYVRDGGDLPSFLQGGGQEGGRRAGTENVLLIVGMGRAAKIVTDELADTMEHTGRLRDRLLELLSNGLAACGVAFRVNGPEDRSRRLPNTLSISIEGVNGGNVLLGLRETVAASAAAACHAGEAASAVSSVIQALGVSVRHGVRWERRVCA